MKKQILMLLALCCLLCACSRAPEEAQTPSSEATSDTTAETVPYRVTPLPETLDLQNLTDATLSVTLMEGDAYVDDEGRMQMKLCVYVYQLFDAVDLSRLQSGDEIVVLGQEITVEDILFEDRSILINGGLDHGGLELWTDDNTVYYQISYSDVKFWYSLGEVTLRVSPDFLYTDASDLDRDPLTFYPGDFLIGHPDLDYYFDPSSTTVLVEDGIIVAMNRTYIP